MQVSVPVHHRAAEAVGGYSRDRILEVRRFFQFLGELLRNLPSVLNLFHITLDQMYAIGITSIPLVITTSVFTGGITAWQMAFQFADMIPMTYVGMAVGKSVMLELGPMLTAMVMAGRIGAAMCSEIATMAVTEQLDAMKCLGLNPYKFLLVPRLMAAVLMLPILTILSSFVALIGGFAVSHFGKDVSFDLFFYGVRLFYTNWDLAVGLIKATMFGFIIASFATFFGYHTTHGAEGVGRSTKATVVASMTSILVFGFLASKFLLI